MTIQYFFTFAQSSCDGGVAETDAPSEDTEFVVAAAAPVGIHNTSGSDTGPVGSVHSKFLGDFLLRLALIPDERVDAVSSKKSLGANMEPANCCYCYYWKELEREGERDLGLALSHLEREQEQHRWLRHLIEIFIKV